MGHVHEVFMYATVALRSSSVVPFVWSDWFPRDDRRENAENAKWEGAVQQRLAIVHRQERLAGC